METIIGKSLIQAAQFLNNNQLVAMPTETVYGLAGNAFSSIAVQQIYAVKKRPSYNPLIVHIPNIQYLNTIAKNIPKKILFQILLQQIFHM